MWSLPFLLYFFIVIIISIFIITCISIITPVPIATIESEMPRYFKNLFDSIVNSSGTSRSHKLDHGFYTGNFLIIFGESRKTFLKIKKYKCGFFQLFASSKNEMLRATPTLWPRSKSECSRPLWEPCSLDSVSEPDQGIPKKKKKKKKHVGKKHIENILAS